MSYSNDAKATGASATFDFGKDSVTGNDVSKVVLADTNGNFITPMQQTGGSVTALSSLIGPTSTLTRPASAVTSSVTATSASPCVFTWTANPLANGQTIVLGGTVPTGFTAGLTYYVVAQATNTFQLAATAGGTAINSSSTGSGVTATLTYASNELIGSAVAAGSIVVPSFTLANAIQCGRIRVRTNATTGWNAVNLSLNFWSAAPTYNNGDLNGIGYSPATGSASWLANFLVGLTQFGDGASGGGPLTSANQLSIPSGVSPIYWDIQIMSAATPIVSQTFTLTVEANN